MKASEIWFEAWKAAIWNTDPDFATRAADKALYEFRQRFQKDIDEGEPKSYCASVIGEAQR